MTGFKNALYSIMCIFMDAHIPQGSGFSMIKKNNENSMRWCINWHAFNYHDESWEEYEDISIRIFYTPQPHTEEFIPIKNSETFNCYKFYELVTEFANNSDSVQVCNRGWHQELDNPEYNRYYWYSEDIEFIFENLYKSNAVVYLRYAKYNDRN